MPKRRAATVRRPPARPGSRSRRQAKLPAPAPASQALVKRAVDFGRSQADLLLARPQIAVAAALRAGSSGILVAEGDSWFDYPVHDVLERLEDQHGFRVESVAHSGDWIEDMAYNPAQGAALMRTLTRLRDDGKTPRAILLSGGGNDLVGDGFGALINHASSGLPALNAQIVSGLINERLLYAYGCVIGRVNQMTQALFPNPVPIVIHGYGHAVPDGRGFLGGVWFLPGPWLRPGFDKKGHTSLPANTGVVATLIDLFNTMLQSLPTFPNIQNVTYLDLRPVLKSTVAGDVYQQDWANEIHPTTSGYGAVATAFANLIATFPMP